MIVARIERKKNNSVAMMPLPLQIQSRYLRLPRTHVAIYL
jgi:hypothetical protein